MVPAGLATLDHMADKTDYCARFQQAMRESGKTEQQIADHLDVSYQAVRKLMTGGTKMLNAANNVKAARFMGVDSEWLATGVADPERVQLAGDEAAMLAAFRRLPSTGLPRGQALGYIERLAEGASLGGATTSLPTRQPPKRMQA